MGISLNSLKISQKLWLSVLSFSIPILMLLYFTVSGINYDINFARLEIFGNRLLAPLTELLALVPKHQRLVVIPRLKNPPFIDNLTPIKNLIENNLETLEKETEAVGTQLKITPSQLKEAGMEKLLPATITEQWQRLQSSQNLNKEQLAQQYSDLKQLISGLISRVGDTSNLILDPDLDSYYLMDVVLLALPQAQQRVGEILLYSQGLSSQNQLANPEKVKLEVYASSLQNADLERIVQGISTSVREDKNFYGELPSLQNIPPVLSSYEAAVKKFSETLIQLARTGSIDILNESFFQQGEEVVSKGSELWTVTRKELDKLIERRIQDLENKRLIYLGSSLIALGISIFLVFQISREITVRIFQAGAITKDVAQGDFTIHVRIDSQDEIGQLLSAIKYMIKNLNSLIKQTQESGIQVSASATELLATAKQQEVVVTNQAELIIEVMKSTQEISQLIENLVQQISQVASTSQETAKFARNSQSDIIQMKETMQNMENASKNISRKLQTIDERTKNVTVVLTTITKLAEQTNLLSLNAAIEAEKAGEAGRGFAVVAREIRRLADQTAVASLDIERIINDMQLAVLEGVMEMNNFIPQFYYGADKISKISSQLGKIIQQVQALSPQAQTISSSMVNLGQGMGEIKDSLSQTYLAIEDLNKAAISLRDRVSQFKVNA